MEAPFRFPIRGVADVERLIDALASLPDLMPGSLRLAEGADLLAQQWAAEGRSAAPLRHTGTPAGLAALFRTLWAHPLAAQRPRFLRLEAQLAADPAVTLSLRIDVPTVDAKPRWVDLEAARDPAVLQRQLAAYRALGRAAGLELQAV